jgi:hypothetical protein
MCIIPPFRWGMGGILWRGTNVCVREREELSCLHPWWQYSFCKTNLPLRTSILTVAVPILVISKVKVKLILQQSVKAHSVVGRRGSHIFWSYNIIKYPETNHKKIYNYGNEQIYINSELEQAREPYLSRSNNKYINLAWRIIRRDIQQYPPPSSHHCSQNLGWTALPVSSYWIPRKNIVFLVSPMRATYLTPYSIIW